MTPTLRVQDLSVAYRRPDGTQQLVVSNAYLNLQAGEVLGLAGESGCGKSTTALCAIGFRTRQTQILGGQSLFQDRDLFSLSNNELRDLWGSRIAFVAQDSRGALNPATTIGRQFDQVLRRIGFGATKAIRERLLELLSAVAIPDPASALRRYPHQFSGGQLQRICIAMAMACNPAVLVLDEPTSGLDVTTQARISSLIRDMVKLHQVAALYVSHDLALLREYTNRLAIMYAGQVVEEGLTEQVIQGPKHPYTRSLLDSVPSVVTPREVKGIRGQPPPSVVTTHCAFADRCDRVSASCISAPIELTACDQSRSVRCLNPLSEERRVFAAIAPHVQISGDPSASLEVRDLWCAYRGREQPAVKSVSFKLRPAEVLGIVGESGSGKSTLLRSIIGLQPYNKGEVLFKGKLLPSTARKRPLLARMGMQIIFQNPDSSLNPRHTIAELIGRPLRLLGSVDRSFEEGIIRKLLESVSLDASVMHRLPTELSGGQKQRVAIARAFAPNPAVVLCDEITSALDVSVQATVLKLLRDLAAQRSTSLLFVSHNLAVVRLLANDCIVMRYGEVVETASTAELFENPQHPYSRMLLGAIPDLETPLTASNAFPPNLAARTSPKDNSEG